MRRAAAWMLAAVVAITTAVVFPGPASAGSRADAWRSRAWAALNAYEQGQPGTSAHPVAYATGASAMLRGWDHPATREHLARLYELRNPDGGWGSNVAWDPFSDGTTNP